MKNEIKQKKRSSSDYAIAVIFILAVTAIIFIAWTFFDNDLKETAYATSTNIFFENVNYNEENIFENEINKQENIQNMQYLDIDLNEIINNNTKNIRKEEIIIKEKDLEYTTRYSNNPELPKGVLQVIQDGVDGKQEVYTKKIYIDDKLISEEEIGSKVTRFFNR